MAVQKKSILSIVLVIILSLGFTASASAQRKSTAALARLDPIHSGSAFGGVKTQIKIIKEQRKYRRALAKWKRKRDDAFRKFERKRRKERLKEAKRRKKEREKLMKEIRKEQEQERRKQEKIRKARQAQEESTSQDIEVEEAEVAEVEGDAPSQGKSVLERKRKRTQNRPTFWAKFWRAIVGPKT